MNLSQVASLLSSAAMLMVAALNKKRVARPASIQEIPIEYSAGKYI